MITHVTSANARKPSRSQRTPEGLGEPVLRLSTVLIEATASSAIRVHGMLFSCIWTYAALIVKRVRPLAAVRHGKHSPVHVPVTTAPWLALQMNPGESSSENNEVRSRRQQ